MSPRPGSAGRCRDAWHPGGRVREPEERQQVAAADVEEEVLAHAVRQLQRLDERKPEDVPVELDGLGHVAAHQRQVVHAAELKFVTHTGLPCGHRAFSLCTQSYLSF